MQERCCYCGQTVKPTEVCYDENVKGEIAVYCYGCYIGNGPDD